MRVQIDGPTVMLKLDSAQAIGVALHELAINAAKYGALSVANGQVRVEWLCAADQVVLRWIEAGGQHPPTRKGFGDRMVEAMIRRHEGGNVRVNCTLMVSRAKSLFRYSGVTYRKAPGSPYRRAWRGAGTHRRTNYGGGKTWEA
jgi:hypothetical protein